MNVTGVLDYSFNLYRIQPIQGAEYIPLNPRLEDRPDVGGRLQIAAMNTLNYFLTAITHRHPLDNKCGPLLNMDCRGGPIQTTEFARQRTKLLQLCRSGCGGDRLERAGKHHRR